MSCIAIAAHEPNCSSDIPSPLPITGSAAIATALNRKIIDKEINKSFGFALINGAIAAIAVAPHIAVPDAIKIASF